MKLIKKLSKRLYVKNYVKLIKKNEKIISIKDYKVICFMEFVYL